MKAEAVAEFAQELRCDVLGVGPDEASYGQGLVSEISQLSGNKALNGVQASPSQGISTSAASHFLIGCCSPPPQMQSNSQVASSGDDPAITAFAAKAKENGEAAILITTASKTSAERLAQLHPSLSLIIYQSLGTATQSPEAVGKTWLVSPGDLGREALVVTYSNNGPVLLKPVPLGPDFANAKKGTEVMDDYLHQVDQAQLLKLWPRSKTIHYVGSKACLSCHRADFNRWHSSAHSHAYLDLLKQGHGLDPDCVKCHVTGLSSTCGFLSQSKTPQLANVTCESCHGPGGAHILNPKWAKMNLGTKVCVTCHTQENSPNFNFASYWLKIKHH